MLGGVSLNCRTDYLPAFVGGLFGRLFDLSLNQGGHFKLAFVL
jgi:hypothetical protein